MKPTVVRPLLPVVACSLAAIALVACRDRQRDQSDRTHPSVISERDDQDRSGTTTLTGASFLSSESGVDRIVAARCARELTCSKVGPDKHFPTTDSCVVEVRKRTRADLDTSACTNGIDGAALDKCLDAIRNESCENPIDTIGRMVSCRTGELCAKEPTPHR